MTPPRQNRHMTITPNSPQKSVYSHHPSSHHYSIHDSGYSQPHYQHGQQQGLQRRGSLPNNLMQPMSGYSTDHPHHHYDQLSQVLAQILPPTSRFNPNPTILTSILPRNTLSSEAQCNYDAFYSSDSVQTHQPKLPKKMSYSTPSAFSTVMPFFITIPAIQH